MSHMSWPIFRQPCRRRREGPARRELPAQLHRGLVAAGRDAAFDAPATRLAARRSIRCLLLAIAQARELPIPTDQILERCMRVGRARIGGHEHDRAFAALRLLAEARELDVPADRAREAVEAG